MTSIIHDTMKSMVDIDFDPEKEHDYQDFEERERLSAIEEEK